MRTLGLLGGMSWESTQLYYRLLNEGVRQRRGGLHSAPLLLWSPDFADIAARQAAGDWDSLARILGEAGKRLADAGAEAILLCTNTMHRLHAEIEHLSGLPLLHIADPTGAALSRAGAVRPVLLATRYTMEGAFYRDRLADRFGLDPLIPDEPGRTQIHDIIYTELCQGIIRPESRQIYLDVIDSLRQRGADSVILGCTEIALLLRPTDTDLPLIDTTALHAAAGVDFLLSPDTP